jgi:hypothetical protein
MIGAGIVVNGGAGASGQITADGENGQLGLEPALGGICDGSCGTGGNGGASTQLAGAPGGSQAHAGGGGGGIGRIRIHTRGGSALLGPDGFTSPTFGETPTTATQGIPPIE